jgi:hypothetical protein
MNINQHQATCVKLGWRPIIWCCRKQSNVAFSSTEVEYRAIIEGAKEATWL